MLRPALLEDAAELQACCWHHLTYAESVSRLQNVAHWHNQGRCWGIVALDGGRITGYGQLERLWQRWEICNLVVAPAYRRRGIGTALIEHLLCVAAQQGAQAADIGVEADNVQALALYQRLGFHERHRVEVAAASIIYLSKPLHHEEA